jgi:outer membrane protein assembly factor BamA
MSTFQLLGSLFLSVFLYSFPWIVCAAEPPAGPAKIETVSVKDVTFTGNTFVDAAKLKDMVVVAKAKQTALRAEHAAVNDWVKNGAKGLPPGAIPLVLTYDLADADADVAKLEDYYRRYGFLQVHVAREVVFDKEFRATGVVFHITEGERYYLLERPPVGNSR